MKSPNITGRWLVTATVLSLGLAGCGSQLSNRVWREIHSQVAGRAQAYSACYRAALKRDGGARGTVVLNFLVAKKTGGFHFVKVRRSEMKDRTLERCVVATTSNLKARGVTNKSVEVVYPIRFTPESDDDDHEADDR